MEWHRDICPWCISFRHRQPCIPSAISRHLFLELDLCLLSPVLDTLLPGLSMPVFLPVNNQHHGEKKLLMLALSPPGRSNSHILDCHTTPQVRIFLFRNREGGYLLKGVAGSC